jgi:hypothetical protein
MTRGTRIVAVTVTVMVAFVAVAVTNLKIIVDKLGLVWYNGVE